jgi:DNA-binding MarR family transcriptional regulator
MGFLADEGVLALGSRFKVLSDRLYDAVDRVYSAHGSIMQARWFPVLKLLADRGPMTIGDLAREIGQTHPAVSQLAGKLVGAGLVRTRGDRDDRRRRWLALTARGESEIANLRTAWRAIGDTMSSLVDADFLARIDLLERMLDERPLHERLLEGVAAEARRRLRIVPWDPALRGHFYDLNAEWLRKYFYIEQIDHEVLSNPEVRIIEPGGEILFALLGDEVVGTCALLQEAPGVFELTKMAVTERVQGIGIGRALLAQAIAAFRKRKGRELFLESNSRLPNAIRLYADMGFEQQPGKRPDSHYSRSDVYMIWRDPEAANAGRKRNRK